MPQSLLQPLHPFCQLGRRVLYNYCFIYMYIVDDTKVTLYADWGDYFLHLDSIPQFGIRNSA